MFDIGWQEIFVIGVLALIVVGPKDLPRVLKTATQMIGKARSLAREFQNGVNEVVREADLDDLKKQVADAQTWDIDKALDTALDKEGLEEQLDIEDSAAGMELEKDYQARKKAAEDRARQKLAEDIEAGGTMPTPEPVTEAEPADHELDGGDDEPEQAETAPEPEGHAKQPEPAAKA